MRRRAAVAVATAAAALFAAAAVPAQVEPPAPGPTMRLVKADVARARSVTLRAADVFSNFTRSSSPSHLPTIAHCDGYPGDRSDTTITGQARSAFRLGSFSIGSTVLWFKTAADASRYWKKTVRLQYIRCRAAALVLVNGAGEHVEPHIAQAAPIALRRTAAEKAIAYRLVGGVPATPGAGNDSYNYIDTNVFLKVGRSVAMLRTVWITNNCDCYHDLARTLAKRLKAAR